MIKIKLLIESSSMVPSEVIDSIAKLRNELRLSKCECSEYVPPLLCLCSSVLIKVLFLQSVRNVATGFRSFHGISLLMTIEATEPSTAYKVCDKVSRILRSLGFKVTLSE